MPPYTNIMDVHLWKYRGDEVIYYVHITDLKSATDAVSDIYNVLLQVCDYIETRLKNSHVSLKATAWIAAVANKETSEGESENYFLITTEGESRFYEFLGPEIDKGFRIANETSSGKLVLSFELACLCDEQFKAEKRKSSEKPDIRVVAYRQLKGVWNSEKYPIIMYFPPKERDVENKRDTIPTIVRKLHDKRMQGRMKKLLNDKDKAEKIDNIRRVIGKHERQAFRINPLVEFHCTAICYTDDGKVLIGKRQGRSHHNGCWDFGGGPANRTSNIKKRLVELYRQDFGIKIEPKMILLGTEKKPEPLTLYDMKLANEETFYGATVLARITAEPKAKSWRYSEVRLVEAGEIAKQGEEEFVDGVYETLKIVFSRIGQKNTLCSDNEQ